MSGKSKQNVEQVGKLLFQFRPKFSVNSIDGQFPRGAAISVYDEGLVEIDSGNLWIKFSIAELRFMADCAEKLQKARVKK